MAAKMGGRERSLSCGPRTFNPEQKVLSDFMHFTTDIIKQTNILIQAKLQ